MAIFTFMQIPFLGSSSMAAAARIGSIYGRLLIPTLLLPLILLTDAERKPTQLATPVYIVDKINTDIRCGYGALTSGVGVKTATVLAGDTIGFGTQTEDVGPFCLES